MKSSPSSIVIPHHDFLKKVNHPAAVVSMNSPLESRTNLFFKRSFDLYFSTFAIIFLLSWLIPLMALLIRLDSKGPVFFTQKRAKRAGRLFTCIKFRTMIQNDEANTLAAYLNDQRVTKFGKFLRLRHLDELPQLLNVWWGDMSLIGPRPHMESDDKRFESMMEQYSFRYRVKPGITGLAQVMGYVGPVVDTENLRERIKQDIYYVHYWSALLDIKIAGLTVFKMLGIK